VNQATTNVLGQKWYSLAAAAVNKYGAAKSLPDDFGLHRIRFAGPAGTFRARSVYEIFAPAMWKDNFASGEFFRDKIVVVGPHGNWSQDEHLTTLGIMPGPELHLNAINAVLSGEFCRMMSRPMSAACLIGAALLAWIMGMLIRKPTLRLMCILAVPVLWWTLAMQLYNRTGDFLPTVAPILVFALIGISGIVADQVFDRMEKARVRRTLERYVSKNVVSGLLSRRDEFAAGIVMPVTILFSDIRNFTRFSAQTEPTALVAQLNEYFTEMVECVFAHGGTVDKFMGDAVMAVWGNATSLGTENDAQNATRCAFAMHAALSRLNRRWAADGRPLFDIGIALNHGKAVVGDIGSPNKMEFTVIGDAVNIAWRLQERTKEHPGEIVIGDTVSALIAGKIHIEPGGIIRVGDEIDVPYSIAHLSALKSDSISN
jgi:adenylate cyclase